MTVFFCGHASKQRMVHDSENDRLLAGYNSVLLDLYVLIQKTMGLVRRCY